MIDEHGPDADVQPVLRTLERVPGIGRHLPARPDWTCAAGCPDPWPCPHARERITAAANGDRVDLAMTMARVLNAAVADLVHIPGDHDLFRRMLAWTR
ncbi:hypothetical protein [Micromonospora wenchangensis]|uniref:hypothetical protein n=1 Tax=Micromonospora wenchangensis TaxID=1185415 RepID=UPI003800BC02